MVILMELDGVLMKECLFCRIVRKEVPARVLFEDHEILAFEDIHPQAPTHVLIIPKKHISRPREIQPEDARTVGRLFWVAAQVAREQGIDQGYRLVMNNGAAAGQSVFHIHLHLLGGRSMGWPPG